MDALASTVEEEDSADRQPDGSVDWRTEGSTARQIEGLIARAIRFGRGRGARFDRIEVNRRRAWLLFNAGACLAAVLAAWFVGDEVLRRVGLDGWPAYDTRAYWLAGRHVLEGGSLYSPAEIWTFGAFKYPPIFAQLFAPLALLPAQVVDWAWRVVSLLTFRYLAGSWRLAAVLTAVDPAFFAELDLGNVTYLLGAACLWALRDRRGAYLLPWFAALKFGPALLMAYLWVCRREYRQPLLVGTGVFAAACAASFAVAPGLWWDYAGTFGWETASAMHAYWVVAIFPDFGGLDFAARFSLAGLATLAAIHWRRDWVAYAAAIATCPILTTYRLVPLVALWQLWRPRIETALRRAATVMVNPRPGAMTPSPG